MTPIAQPTDEWKLLTILEEYGAADALPAIEAKLNAFCETYIRNRANAQVAANQKLACLLSAAIIDSDDCECDLHSRITEITAGLLETRDAA